MYDGTATSGTYGDTKGCRIYDMLCVQHVYKQVLESIKSSCFYYEFSDVDSDVASICRDYIRGVCSRKKRCKFGHPTVVELNALVGCREDKKYEFCHDHQNKVCERTTCRYIHCTR